MAAGGIEDSAAGALPSLTVAAVARRLGVAPATLRTWDRRYGLGPSQHAAGSHRRYAPGDLERLALMRRLTLEGVTPAEAARVSLKAPTSATPAAGPPVPPALGRGGGGRVVALPDGTPAARGLARAAMALDPRACTDIVAQSISDHGVVFTWEHLLVPVLVGVGERWELTGEGVDVEHLLAECATGALREVAMRLHEPLNPRPVLLACAENDLHSLTLYVLAAALAERGVGTRVLGANLPREALASAVRRSGPAAVFLWSQLPASGHVDQLAALPQLRPAPVLVIGGPGWPDAEPPEGVQRCTDLTGTVERLAAAAGG